MVRGRDCGFGCRQLGFGFSMYQKYFNDRVYPNPKPMTVEQSWFQVMAAGLSVGSWFWVCQCTRNTLKILISLEPKTNDQTRCPDQ